MTDQIMYKFLINMNKNPFLLNPQCYSKDITKENTPRNYADRIVSPDAQNFPKIKNPAF